MTPSTETFVTVVSFMVAVPFLAEPCRRTIDWTAAPTSSVAPGPVRPIHPAPARTRPRSRADPCPAERTVRLSWVEQAARDRLSPHDLTVEQQPRPPDLRRSDSYSVPIASATPDLRFQLLGLQSDRPPLHRRPPSKRIKPVPRRSSRPQRRSRGRRLPSPWPRRATPGSLAPPSDSGQPHPPPR